jgi:hypothetical protein
MQGDAVDRLPERVGAGEMGVAEVRGELSGQQRVIVLRNNRNSSPRRCRIMAGVIVGRAMNVGRASARR